MAESRFVYVTYIRAPAPRIWAALTDPAANRKFWSGYAQRSSFQTGADYSIVDAEDKAWDTGKVLEADPPRRLSVTWTHLHDEAMKAEGESVATFDLAPMGEALTKLTVTHVSPVETSRLIGAVSTGWPMVLSSLKSLMETGEALS
jgi:uncharacterized protein YndB with AHSA1/START domain